MMYILIYDHNCSMISSILQIFMFLSTPLTTAPYFICYHSGLSFKIPVILACYVTFAKTGSTLFVMCPFAYLSFTHIYSQVPFYFLVYSDTIKESHLQKY